jgi:hypothetical protein
MVHARDSVSTTWSHTVSRGCTLVVGLRWMQTEASGSSLTRSVAWNGKPMDNWFGPMGLDNAELTDRNAMFLQFFGLISPQDGPGTITVTVAGRASDINVGGCSLSYAGVRGWGIWSGMFDNSAGTTFMEQVVTSRPNERVLQPNDMVVQMFTSPGKIYTYTQTLRHEGNGFVVGDAPGAKTVPFRASRANLGNYYAGLALRLLCE